MPLDAIQQKSKTIIEASYSLMRQKNKKELEKTKKYILNLADSISKDIEEERKQIKK